MQHVYILAELGYVGHIAIALLDANVRSDDAFQWC